MFPKYTAKPIKLIDERTDLYELFFIAGNNIVQFLYETLYFGDKFNQAFGNKDNAEIVAVCRPVDY